MEFRADSLVKGEPTFKFNKEIPARYGIMKRHCTDVEDIKWFELPNHYVFHFVNAWEKKAPNGDDLVVMFGCVLNDVDLNYRVKEKDGSEHPFLWQDTNNDNRGKLTKFEFNLSTGESSMKLLVDEGSDFPIVNADLVGYESQYAYLTYFAKDIPKEKNGIYSQYFDGVYKYDLINEKMVSKIKFGENKSAGEVFF